MLQENMNATLVLSTFHNIRSFNLTKTFQDIFTQWKSDHFYFLLEKKLRSIYLKINCYWICFLEFKNSRRELSFHMKKHIYIFLWTMKNTLVCYKWYNLMCKYSIKQFKCCLFNFRFTQYNVAHSLKSVLNY